MRELMNTRKASAAGTWPRFIAGARTVVIAPCSGA
jgi:hypothetical protein